MRQEPELIRNMANTFPPHALSPRPAEDLVPIFCIQGTVRPLFALLLLGCMTIRSLAAVDEPKPTAEQIARDRTVVQTLMRLENFDVDRAPTAKATLLRYLRRNPEGEDSLGLIKRFQLAELAPELRQLIKEHPNETRGAEAARLLWQFEGADAFKEMIAGEDGQLATAAVMTLGHLGTHAAEQLLEPLILDARQGATVRRAAVASFGKQLSGQQKLLEWVRDKKLHEELNFAAARALLASSDESIRNAAAKLIELPDTADGNPLPPFAELVKRRGEPVAGAKVYREAGTCIKCHQVGAEGKRVGPALTEIGSKLSREAMYVNILDPNAAVSFGFEQYAVFLADGQRLTGIVISQTDDEIVLKNAEGIERTIPADQIDELVKQKTSIMPTGLMRGMTTDQLVDLVEYLLSLKKKK